MQSSSCTWTLAQRFHSSALRSSSSRGCTAARTACSRTVRSSRSCGVGSGPIVPMASLTSLMSVSASFSDSDSAAARVSSACTDALQPVEVVLLAALLAGAHVLLARLEGGRDRGEALDERRIDVADAHDRLPLAAQRLPLRRARRRSRPRPALRPRRPPRAPASRSSRACCDLRVAPLGGLATRRRSGAARRPPSVSAIGGSAFPLGRARSARPIGHVVAGERFDLLAQRAAARPAPGAAPRRGAPRRRAPLRRPPARSRTRSDRVSNSLDDPRLALRRRRAARPTPRAPRRSRRAPTARSASTPTAPRICIAERARAVSGRRPGIPRPAPAEPRPAPPRAPPAAPWRAWRRPWCGALRDGAEPLGRRRASRRSSAATAASACSPLAATASSSAGIAQPLEGEQPGAGIRPRGARCRPGPWLGEQRHRRVPRSPRAPPTRARVASSRCAPERARAPPRRARPRRRPTAASATSRCDGGVAHRRVAVVAADGRERVRVGRRTTAARRTRASWSSVATWANTSAVGVARGPARPRDGRPGRRASILAWGRSLSRMPMGSVRPDWPQGPARSPLVYFTTLARRRPAAVQRAPAPRRRRRRLRAALRAPPRRLAPSRIVISSQIDLSI